MGELKLDRFEIAQAYQEHVKNTAEELMRRIRKKFRMENEDTPALIGTPNQDGTLQLFLDLPSEIRRKVTEYEYSFCIDPNGWRRIA